MPSPLEIDIPPVPASNSTPAEDLFVAIANLAVTIEEALETGVNADFVQANIRAINEVAVAGYRHEQKSRGL